MRIDASILRSKSPVARQVCSEDPSKQLRILIVAALLLACATGCGTSAPGELAAPSPAVSARSPSIVGGSSTGQEVDAATAAFRHIAESWQAIEAFHFTRGGGVSGQTQFFEGDVVLPDRVAFTGATSLQQTGFKGQRLGLILIGPQSWWRYDENRWVQGNFTLAGVSRMAPIDLIPGLSSATIAEDLGNTTLGGAGVKHLRLTLETTSEPSRPEIWVDENTGYPRQVMFQTDLTGNGTMMAVDTVQFSRFNDLTIRIEPPTP